MGAYQLVAAPKHAPLPSCAAEPEPVDLAKVLKGESLYKADISAYIYTPCPFCTKVRMFMDYYRLPYTKVEVDPLSKKQIKFSDYKKVPIVLVNGEQLNDSTAIISALHASLPADHPLSVPDSEEQQQWRTWVDSHLVHLLPSNIYRNMRESLQSFDYLMDASFSFSATERTMARYSGAVIMHLLCRFKLNKKYNITDPRAQLYDSVNEFADALQGNAPLSL